MTGLKVRDSVERRLMKSKKWNLNKKDLKDITVMAVAAGVSYLVTQVFPFVDFGKYQEIATVAIPVATYAIKKWQQGR